MHYGEADHTPAEEERADRARQFDWETISSALEDKVRKFVPSRLWR